ncbi:molybdate ABC transporter substrate-binding protein [bacterium]|nr:molybdate ABC transporter substrate-binding protein [bacterium]
MSKFFFSISIFLLALLSACTPSKPPLRVAIASSMLLPMNEIAEAFTQETGEKVEINAASSGKLMAQIMNHAPFHIFISANQDYPQKLYNEDFTVDKPKPLVAGDLAFWSNLQGPWWPKVDSVIRNSEISKIAIANADLAPYGESTRHWLKKQGLWETALPKLVYGENVGQVNHFIHSGSVDAAFTSVSGAITIAKSTDLSVEEKGQWIRLGSLGAVPHDIVLLKQTHPQAKAFHEFLFSEKAGEIFKQYGYIKP